MIKFYFKITVALWNNDRIFSLNVLVTETIVVHTFLFPFCFRAFSIKKWHFRVPLIQSKLNIYNRISSVRFSNKVMNFFKAVMTDKIETVKNMIEWPYLVLSLKISPGIPFLPLNSEFSIIDLIASTFLAPIWIIQINLIQHYLDNSNMVICNIFDILSFNDHIFKFSLNSISYFPFSRINSNSCSLTSDSIKCLSSKVAV